MAIKQSTQDHITARLSGGLDAWQVFGIYEYAWACQNCLCGHKIATCFILIRKDDHGPAFGDMVQLGSECIKFVQKANPGLYKWLMTAKAEMDRIKRQMKKQREDEFHASPEWTALSARLSAARTILRLVEPDTFNGKTRLGSLGAGPSAVAKEGAARIRHTMAKGGRFQDVETATKWVEVAENLATQVVIDATPFKAEIEAKLATLRPFLPGYSEFKALADRM